MRLRFLSRYSHDATAFQLSTTRAQLMPPGVADDTASVSRLRFDLPRYGAYQLSFVAFARFRFFHATYDAVSFRFLIFSRCCHFYFLIFFATRHKYNRGMLVQRRLITPVISPPPLPGEAALKLSCRRRRFHFDVAMPLPSFPPPVAFTSLPPSSMFLDMFAASRFLPSAVAAHCRFHVAIAGLHNIAAFSPSIFISLHFIFAIDASSRYLITISFISANISFHLRRLTAA